MNHQWIGERQLHKTILRSLNLENNFTVEQFPKLMVQPLCDKRAAEYRIPQHEVVFNEYHIQNHISSFTHTFFHEVAHSTMKYTHRWNRLLEYYHVSSDDVLNLEERIADIVAFIWCDIFDNHFDFNVSKRQIEKKLLQFLNDNPTNLALPWGEIEIAVFVLLKNKTCPKITITLKYIKKLIMDNGFKVKEGLFYA